MWAETKIIQGKEVVCFCRHTSLYLGAFPRRVWLLEDLFECVFAVVLDYACLSFRLYVLVRGWLSTNAVGRC
jgi:hypothetical protein